MFERLRVHVLIMDRVPNESIVTVRTYEMIKKGIGDMEWVNDWSESEDDAQFDVRQRSVFIL